MNDSRRDRVTISIATSTILKVAAIWLALQFIYVTRDIIILAFIVLVLVAALSPVVRKWSTKMPRPLAVVLLYIFIILIFSAIISLVLPPFISQLIELSNNLPSYIQRVAPNYFSYDEVVSISKNGIENVASGLSGVGGSIFSTTVGFFGGLASVLSVLVLTFYLLLDEQGIKTFLTSFLPIHHKQRIVSILQKIGEKVGRWMNGQLLLMLLIGAVDFIGLLVISFWEPELRQYILVLGVWAGLTEVIPYIGPWLGAVPAVLIGFVISPWIGLAIFAFFMFVQQLEGQFLVPKIMARAVGLSPVIVIFSLLIGGKLLGILGIVLAVPFAAAISVIFSEWDSIRRLIKNTT